MKKILSLVLILCCLVGSAYALTVSEFVDRYNDAIGKGFYTVRANELYIEGDYWFVSGSDNRQMVILFIDKDSSDNALNYTVKSVLVRHKPRVSVGVFINNISSALAASFPDVPEDERLAEAMRCLATLDRDFADYSSSGTAYPWNTEHMGQFVYQEETEYQTFLFSMTDEAVSSSPDQSVDTPMPDPTSTPKVYDRSNAIELPIGEYTVGVDFPAGVYDVLADSSVDEIGFFVLTADGGFLYGHIVGNEQALQATLPEGASVKTTKGNAILIPEEVTP